MWAGVSLMVGVLQKCYLLRSEMLHLIHNLHNYMMFEVMECAWTDLTNSIEKVRHLAHLLCSNPH